MTRPGLIRLAWLNVALHTLGLAFAALGMHPGTAAVSLPERMVYLAGRPLGWTLGWGVWVLCMVAMVAFAAALASRPNPRPNLARFAAVVALVAGSFDLLGDSLFILVLPSIAELQPPPERMFLVVEQAIGIESLVVANTLYALSTLLMAFAVRGDRLSRAVAIGVFVFGLVLSAAPFTGSVAQIELATGLTIGLYGVWALLVAYQREPA